MRISRLSGRISERQFFAIVLVAIVLAVCSAVPGRSQTSNDSERTFPQSKNAVEQAVKKMQSSLAGRLPALEGFVDPASHSLGRYQRAYYQSTVQVTSNPSGGSSVRVSAKITAWYADPVAAHSGYRLLNSNGRLEADLLDQLSDELAPKAAGAPAGNPTVPATRGQTEPQNAVAPPVPNLSGSGDGTFSSSLKQSLSARQPASPRKQVADSNAVDSDKSLQAETKNLEEILKNQAHPENLVAVKKSGTPVVATPSLTAKTLFLASAHDEFEMLNFNADWVHVRISGLSRGWIWRNSLEMPEGIPDVVDAHAPSGPRPADGELFHVTREETAPFPGDWEPLRSKNVKIISVQRIDEPARDEGPQVKLEFAKSLFNKNYAELEKKAQEVAGIVLIFDSADGGMLAVPVAVLREWKAGKWSDAALWHQCFFDPPGTFGPAGVSASQ